MRRLILIVIVLFFCLKLDYIAGQDGLEIIKKAYFAYRNLQAETEQIEVELVDVSTNSKRCRKLLRKIYYKEPGKDRVLLVATAPEFLKGTALLAWRAGKSEGESQKKDMMWLWLPTWKRYWQFAPLDKKTYFIGLPLSYPDLVQLIGEDWWNYHYEVVEENNRDWVLKAIPKEGTLTEYDFRLIWIRKDNLFPEKYEFYKNGYRCKELICREIKKQGPVWRANKVEVKIFEKGKLDYTGNFKFLSREINPKISERYFSLKTLERQEW